MLPSTVTTLHHVIFVAIAVCNLNVECARLIFILLPALVTAATVAIIPRVPKIRVITNADISTVLESGPATQQDFQTSGICGVDGAILSVAIKVGISAAKEDRVFGRPSADLRVVARAPKRTNFVSGS